MGVPTKFYVVPLPDSVGPWESFGFAGTLYYYAGGELWLKLEGGIVELYMDNVKVDETISDGLGQWQFWLSLPRGIYTLRVRFPGDATYDPCSTGIYTITVVGVETRITVVEAPPDVGVGEPFYISGVLEEYVINPPYEPVWKRMLDKVVELYVDGANVKSERTGSEIDGTNQGRWRFAVPAPQTLGVHTVEVRFLGDDTYEPCLPGVIEFNAIESGVVATIENVTVPTKVAPWERWSGYFHLCNRGTGAGNVRAVIQGDVDGETPIITMNPGDCQTIAVGGIGPKSFTIRTGV